MDQDKINQAVAWIIGIALAIIAYIRGRKAVVPTIEAASSAERELVRLKEERQQNHDRQTTLDIRAVRADFELIVQAMKESNNAHFEDVDRKLDVVFERLRTIELGVAVLNDRQNRSH